MDSYTLTAKEAAERADLWEQVKRGEVKVTRPKFNDEITGFSSEEHDPDYMHGPGYWFTTDNPTVRSFVSADDYVTVTRLTAQNVSAASSAPADPANLLYFLESGSRTDRYADPNTRNEWHFVAPFSHYNTAMAFAENETGQALDWSFLPNSAIEGSWLSFHQSERFSKPVYEAWRILTVKLDPKDATNA